MPIIGLLYVEKWQEKKGRQNVAYDFEQNVLECIICNIKRYFHVGKIEQSNIESQITSDEGWNCFAIFIL